MHSAHGLITNAIIHNLALAASYGGTLFGKTALRKAAIQGVSDDVDRGKVLDIAWTTFNQKVNVPSHVLFTATWLRERRAIKHFVSNPHTARIVRTKDALIAGALLTGVANTIAGKMLKRDFPEGIPIPAAEHLSPEKAATLAKYVRFFKVVGNANLALLGASIAIGPLLGASVVFHATHRGLLSRLLKR